MKIKMKFGYAVVLLAVCAMLGFSSCGNDSDPNQSNPTTPTIELIRSEMTINESINAFGIDMMNAVAADEDIIKDYPNFAISPVSLALGMSINANTFDEDFISKMCDRFDCEDIAELNALSRKLMMYLPDPANRCDLALSNSVWHTPAMTPSGDYSRRIGEYFFGKITPLDFTSAGAADVINSWADGATKGMIKKIVSDDDIAGASIFLANAFYFKSTWSEPFDKNLTEEADFHAAAGDVKAKFMKADRELYYYGCGDFEAVSLNYTGPFQLIAVLPAEGVAEDFARSFTIADLNNIVERSDRYSVKLSLPRFKSSLRMSCKKAFDAVGLDFGSVRFVGFNPAYSDIIASAGVNHITKVITDEEGTVAAAITATGGFTDAGVVGRVELDFNRPFIYFIRNNVTGTIIMAGQVSRP